MAKPVALGGQLGFLLDARVGRLDLVELERDQVELALARAGQLAQLVARRSRSRTRSWAVAEPVAQLRLASPQ